MHSLVHLEFSLSRDNKSKNQLIVLKFGKDMAFLYLQIVFVAQKNRTITADDIWGQNLELLKIIFG